MVRIGMIVMDTIDRLLAPFTGRSVFTVIGRTLVLWQDRARQRAHLASLDHRMLRDIGLSRADVAGEASKPFWRA